jgi:hypothetical protein
LSEKNMKKTKKTWKGSCFLNYLNSHSRSRNHFISNQEQKKKFSAAKKVKKKIEKGRHKKCFNSLANFPRQFCPSFVKCWLTTSSTELLKKNSAL